MTDKVVDFMTELATNVEMQEAYKQDSRKLMESHELDEADIQLMLNKDLDAIKARLGAEYSIGVMDIISAIKKK